MEKLSNVPENEKLTHSLLGALSSMWPCVFSQTSRGLFFVFILSRGLRFQGGGDMNFSKISATWSKHPKTIFSALIRAASHEAAPLVFHKNTFNSMLFSLPSGDRCSLWGPKKGKHLNSSICSPGSNTACSASFTTSPDSSSSSSLTHLENRETASTGPLMCVFLYSAAIYSRLHDGWLGALSSLADFIQHPIITDIKKKAWTSSRMRSLCSYSETGWRR